jgi:hypothetical protein
MTTHLANPIGPQIRPLLGVSLAILRCPSPRHWAADAVVLGGTMDRSPWTIWQYHMELWIFSWYSMRIIVFLKLWMRTLLRFASLIMQFTPFSINLWWPFFPEVPVCFTKKQSHTVKTTWLYGVPVTWSLWHGVFIVIAVSWENCSASETSRDFPTLLICERLHVK